MEVGSSSLFVSGSPDSSDSLHGLKFGKKIYFEDVFIGPAGSSSAVSVTAAGTSFGPARKGKSQGAAQPPRCQVEGCMVDLSDAKAYYSRHKVCGMHSKSPKVIVAGIEKRFCQQCSRFHQLHEFDQGKRSCRRKLAGHNERRRKPPAASLLSRNGQLLPIFHGGNSSRTSSSVLDFSYPKLVQPSTTCFGNGSHGRPSCHQWQAAGGGGGGGFGTNVSLPAGFGNTEPPGGGAGTYIGAAADSSCALSLLSSQQWNTAMPARTQMPQPLFHSYTTTNSWGFKEHDHHCAAVGGGSSHAVRNEMEFNHPQFSGELELALQGRRHSAELDPSRGYVNSHDGIHWSL